MSNLALFETGVAPLPAVFLTPRALSNAERHRFRGIEPSPEGIAAIAALSHAPARLLPDITIMRMYGGDPSTWDQTYRTAHDDFPYVPTDALARTLDVRAVAWTRRNIQQHAAATGKIVLDLSVRNWDELGIALSDAIEEAQRQGGGLRSIRQIGSRIFEPFDAAHSLIRGALPGQERAQKAASIQPYTIHRGLDVLT